MARSTRRPVVVLPQPLSPTRPSVSPGAMVKLTPSTARTTRAPARKQRASRPPREGEVLDEVLDAQQRRAQAGGALRLDPTALATWQADVVAGADRAQARDLGGAARLGDAAARMEAAARRQRPEPRHDAGDGAEPPRCVLRAGRQAISARV